MSKVFSTDETNFSSMSIDEAVDDQLQDNDELQVGSVITVWEGDTVPINVVPTADWLIEQMAETAHGQAGEFAEGYLLDVTSEQTAELQSGLNSLVENWLNAHQLQPTFYTVENVKKLEVKITGLNSGGGFEYQILPQH